MYACMNVCVLFMCPYVWIDGCIHVRVHVWMYVYVSVCHCLPGCNMYDCMPVCTPVRMHVCMYGWVMDVCVCMYVCMCMYVT